jgi:hypothetical protein
MKAALMAEPEQIGNAEPAHERLRWPETELPPLGSRSARGRLPHQAKNSPPKQPGGLLASVLGVDANQRGASTITT